MPHASHDASLQAQQEHDDAKEVFDMLNDQLIAELPQLLDLRIPYFDPSFEAMIRMQCKFAEEGYEKLGGVQRFGGLCSIASTLCLILSMPQIFRRQRTRRLRRRSVGRSGMITDATVLAWTETDAIV